jgi:hypothetical protein
MPKPNIVTLQDPFLSGLTVEVLPGKSLTLVEGGQRKSYAVGEKARYFWRHQAQGEIVRITPKTVVLARPYGGETKISVGEFATLNR